MYVYIFPKWTIFAQYKLGCWWHFHSQNSQKNSPHVLLLSKVFGIFFPWNVIPTPIQLLYNNSFDSCCLESAWKKTRKVELKKLTAKSFKNFCYCCFYFRIGKIRKTILLNMFSVSPKPRFWVTYLTLRDQLQIAIKTNKKFLHLADAFNGTFPWRNFSIKTLVH